MQPSSGMTVSDGAATLGPPMLAMVPGVRKASLPSTPLANVGVVPELVPVPSVPLQPPPPVDLLPLTLAVEALTREVTALRADIASRTLAARLRRLWSWLRELF